jgi:hypothetical protein
VEVELNRLLRWFEHYFMCHLSLKLAMPFLAYV